MSPCQGKRGLGRGRKLEHFLFGGGGFSTVFLAQRKRNPFSRGVEVWTKKRVWLGEESKALAE